MEDASELKMLRSRLVASAVEERRRVERALHDGLQQDLIALSVELQLVRGLVERDAAAALVSLDRIREEVRAALGRLQTLASEIYPAILDVRGLPDALRQAARTSGAAASVDAAELGRYSAEIETAVYFLWRAVLDALEPGADAGIRVQEEGEALLVTIEAGRAIDPAPARDLVEASGGALTVTAEPDACRIEARFSLA